MLDLSCNGPIFEYVMAWRIDNNPIYLINLIFNSNEGTFKIASGAGFIDASIYLQIKALEGMEIIVSQGLIWQKSSSFEDLYQAVSSIISTI